MVFVLHLVLPAVSRNLDGGHVLALLLALLCGDSLVLLSLLLHHIARRGQLLEVVARQHTAALANRLLKELQRVRRVAALVHLLSQFVRQLLVVRDVVQLDHVQSLFCIANVCYG